MHDEKHTGKLGLRFAIIFCVAALLIPLNPNNSASAPSTNIINFTDYKRGYSLGQLLAKNCHDRMVINGSRLFISGFLDGYDTMNITQAQDEPLTMAIAPTLGSDGYRYFLS